MTGISTRWGRTLNLRNLLGVGSGRATSAGKEGFRNARLRRVFGASVRPPEAHPHAQDDCVYGLASCRRWEDATGRLLQSEDALVDVTFAACHLWA